MKKKPSLLRERPFFVEMMSKGCTHCGHDRQWAVVGPNGAATGQSWSDREEACYISNLLNDAFQDGQEEVAKRMDKIVSIIDHVEQRCQAVDGDVENTRKEMTDKEMANIYKLASGKR